MTTVKWTGSLKHVRASVKRKNILANQAAHHPAVVQLAMRHAANIQLRVADAITTFAGSMKFVYIHAVLFLAWMGFNLLAPAGFDRYPFGLLTLIVSLEAIFLSTFVMIGQNRQAVFQQEKADHDFATEHKELDENTQLTRQIYEMSQEMQRLQREVHAFLVKEGQITPDTQAETPKAQ